MRARRRPTHRPTNPSTRASEPSQATDLTLAASTTSPLPSNLRVSAEVTAEEIEKQKGQIEGELKAAEDAWYVLVYPSGTPAVLGVPGT